MLIAKLVRKILVKYKYRKCVLRKEGSGCVYRQLRSGSTLNHPDKITLGNNVHIGPNYSLNGEGGLDIGDGTTLAPEVLIFTSNHNYGQLALEALPYDNKKVAAAVKIGKYCWIGQRVIILPGVTIGDHVVIGAGAVVTKDLPDYSLCAGSPARVIKERNKEETDKLLQEKAPFVYQKFGHAKQLIKV